MFLNLFIKLLIKLIQGDFFMLAIRYKYTLQINVFCIPRKVSNVPIKQESIQISIRDL